MQHEFRKLLGHLRAEHYRLIRLYRLKKQACVAFAWMDKDRARNQRRAASGLLHLMRVQRRAMKAYDQIDAAVMTARTIRRSDCNRVRSE